MSDDLTLGRLLGRREAFSIVAARCSAAEAQAMLQIRDQKLYLNHAKDWDEFCRQYFHTGKDNANRIIRLLEEFGPTYFEVAQLTRVSPATYRAIAPSIRDQALHHNGEAIALIPENAEKVAAAVADLRKAAAPAPRPEDPMPAIEKECGEMVRKLAALGEQRQWTVPLKAVVSDLRLQLHILELNL